MVTETPYSRPHLTVRRHDRLQLELKTRLPADEALHSDTRFVLDAWLLPPASLAIGPAHGAAAELYADLRVFSRMGTPEIPLAHLVDPMGEGSPMASLRVLAGTRPAGPGKRWQRDVRREARLVVRTLRNAGRAVLYDPGPREDAALDELHTHLREARDQFRSLHAALDEQRLSSVTKRCLDACDEYLSMQVELMATRAVAQHDEAGGPAEVRARLVALAREELDRRARLELRSRVPRTDSGPEAEAFLDQAGLLKRHVERVLHLHVVESSRHRQAHNAILGVAAALAMTWAVAVQILTFHALDMDLSHSTSWGFLSAFSGIAVLAYILKDRIKAWSATVLSRELPRFIDDRGHVLTWGGSDTLVGDTRERLTWVELEEMPDSARDRLHRALPDQLVADTRESLLHYRRRTTLHPRSAVTAFPRFTGLTEVMRFNTSRWVRTLASRHRRVVALDEHDQPVERRLPNRYVTPLVVRLREEGGEQRTWWAIHRVIMSQRGIERIDGPVDVSPGSR
ncbi:MAG: hypothetical protein H6742_00725 [Alphaproteobacteria bacterium]|nr:hypothetical protein [Alphaproteobacteria bacterium]